MSRFVLLLFLVVVVVLPAAVLSARIVIDSQEVESAPTAGSCTWVSVCTSSPEETLRVHHPQGDELRPLAHDASIASHHDASKTGSLASHRPAGHHSSSSSGPVGELQLVNATVGDRVLAGVTIDLHYRLYVPNLSERRWTYDTLMDVLYRTNVWEDAQLHRYLERFPPPRSESGSHVRDPARLLEYLRAERPRIVAEVGVFRGGGTVQLAKQLDEAQLPDSFIVSVDTWLLDLQFVWVGQQNSEYFQNQRIGGHLTMYYTFVQNVLEHQQSHRVVPLPSTSANALLSFIKLQLRPDLIYLDASHANPDVFTDMYGYFMMLADGGLMICDDAQIPAVAAALEAVQAEFASQIDRVENNYQQVWVYKKKKAGEHSHAHRTRSHRSD